MADKQAPSTPVSRPGEPLDLGTSVAGEEDPGAAFDAPGGAEGAAPAGTASIDEKACPECGGSGRLGASSCRNCEGTGKVIAGTGGA